MHNSKVLKKCETLIALPLGKT